jgi:DNA-directed RNA polymerase specialized sigma24 family protein
MHVFISWSGELSGSVAGALRVWLRNVIQGIDVFVSSADIDAGSRWQAEIADRLEAANFGIVCVTRANQASPWLNFEAGALAKAVDGRVVPLAVDLKPSAIKPPLGQFQAQEATEEGVGKIVNSINVSCGKLLDDDVLGKSTEKWWPDLADQLAALRKTATHDAGAESPERSERELLEEVLDTVRAMVRSDRNERARREETSRWREALLMGPSFSRRPEWLPLDRRRALESRLMEGFGENALSSALASLPDLQRQVVQLQVVEERDVDWVAKRLGISRDEVVEARSDALTNIRQALSGAEDPPSSGE